MPEKNIALADLLECYRVDWLFTWLKVPAGNKVMTSFNIPFLFKCFAVELMLPPMLLLVFFGAIADDVTSRAQFDSFVTTDGTLLFLHYVELCLFLNFWW